MVKLPPFMNSQSLGQFIIKFPVITYRRNTLIADGADVHKYIYFLETGQVKQYRISTSGSDFLTYLFYPGSFFPPTVLSGVDCSSSYFEAFTAATVRKIPVEDFMSYLRLNPDLLLELVTLLSRYFGNLSRRINHLAGSSAYQRTAAALVFIGEEIGNPTQNQVYIDQVITHKELAAWSGTARETTSIHMKSLEKKGLISYYKRRIKINNWERLLRETGE